MKKELVKDFPKNLIHRMVEQDSAGWPPHCVSIPREIAHLNRSN